LQTSSHLTFSDELDILSTHTRPQDAEAIEVQIEDIDAETITFLGNGLVVCDLESSIPISSIPCRLTVNLSLSLAGCECFRNQQSQDFHLDRSELVSAAT
jgi:hypothetical protein